MNFAKSSCVDGLWACILIGLLIEYSLASISIFQQPGSALAAQPLQAQPKIRILSAQNVIISTVSQPDATALFGTTQLSSVSGWANFTDLMMLRFGSYTLAFTSSLGDQLSSASFSVSNGLDHFTVSSGPFGTTSAGSPILPAITIQTKDLDSLVLLSAKFPVIASLQIVDATTASFPTVLSANFTSQSCCMFSDCLETSKLFTSCCDCKIPSCALCAMPQNGLVTFPGLKINKAGTYQLLLTTNESSIASLISNPITTLLVPSLITIAQGPPTGISFRVEPAGPIYIGSSGGPAQILPQPVIQKSDSQGNYVSKQPRLGEGVYVTPCFSAADVIAVIPIPAGLCECTDRGCLSRNSSGILLGNLSEPFQSNGIASFANLSVTAAFNAMRLFVANTFNGSWVASVVSQPFQVLPGNLSSIGVMLEPASIQGCPRCPRGVVIANTDFNLTLQLLDAYGNRISQCPAGTSPFCQSTPNTAVLVRLFSGPVDSSMVLGQANLVGVTSLQGYFGVVSFRNLRVLLAGESYTLHFFAVDYMNRSVSSFSDQFEVVSGPPAQLKFVAFNPSILTDSESFALMVDILDAQGNLVISDCYSDCNGLLLSTCSPNITDCSLQARVSIANLGQDSRLVGMSQVSSVQGQVTFNGLAIQANWVSGDSCNCSASKVCAACSSPQCAMPEPWPTFQLSISLLAVASATITTPATLKRRIQSLDLVNQPQAMPAQESIATPLEIQAFQCDGVLATLSTSQVQVSIGSRGQDSFGQLSGTLVTRLSQGVALFTDLQFDQVGTYTLSFTLLSSVSSGYTPSVLSQAFVVSNAVVQLVIVSTPGPSTAGLPFKIQPRIKLLDDTGSAVVLSARVITATLQDNPGELQVQDPDHSYLLGNMVVRAQYGSVAFTDLNINKASLGQDLAREGYTIRFSSGNVGVTSAQFTVQPAEWMGLFLPLFTQPVGSYAGLVLSRQPSVYLVDGFLNRILVSDIPAGTDIQVALVTESSESNVVLQRNGCDEVCTAGNWGGFPLHCTTCRELAFKINSSLFAFTDLRVDVATGTLPGLSFSYRLNFTCLDFVAVTLPFFIQSAAPAYLALDKDIAPFNSADFPLSTQPLLSLRDKFGNIVVDAAHVRVIVSLQLPLGVNITAGQGGLCKLAKHILEGNVSAEVRNGVAQFTNIAVRQAIQGYTLLFTVNLSSGSVQMTSSQFAVTAGAAVGICVMSALGGCSDLSPCMDPASIVCIDAYGNVQPTCTSCYSTSCCGQSPFNVPASLQGPCYAGVCAQLADISTGQSMSFWTADVITDCENASCSEPLLGGAATFPRIALSPPDSVFHIVFTTFIECSGTMIPWSVTQQVNVSAAPPIITNAFFSSSLATVNIVFDKSTNMRLSQPSSCDIFDPVFVAKLGAQALCTWTDPSTILILLGDGSSVTDTTQVLLSPNCGITNQNATSSEEQATTQEGAIVSGQLLAPINVSFPPILPSPEPIMVIPHDLGSCSRLQADASLSQGYAARPFASYSWGIDAYRSYTTVGILEASAPGYPDLKLSSAYFIKAFIHFSTFAPRDLNTVTITLRPSAVVPSSSLLIISGLTGYSPNMLSCPLRSAQAAPMGLCYLGAGVCRAVLLRGESAFRLSATNMTGMNVSSSDANQPRAQWTADGNLIFKVDPSHSIPTSEDTVFSFQMTNPSSLVARSVSISFSFSGPFVCPVADCIVTDSLALTTNLWFEKQAMMTDCNSSDLDSVIAGSMIQSIPCISKLATFYVTSDSVPVIAGNIQETSQVVSQPNVLTLTFQPASPLPPGLAITLSGLTGLSYPANNLCLGGPEAALFECAACVTGTSAVISFGPAGYWNPSLGQLSLALAYGGLQEVQNISISFSLVNSAASNRLSCKVQEAPCPSQAVPTLKLGAAGPLFSLQGNVLGSGEPPIFLSATSDESNPFQNLTNLVMIDFAVNIPLNSQCTLTLSGLPEIPDAVYSNEVDAIGLSCLQPKITTGQYQKLLQLSISSSNQCNLAPDSLIKTWFAIRNIPSGNNPTLSLSASCPSSGTNIQTQIQSNRPLFRSSGPIQFYDGNITADNPIPHQSSAIRFFFRCSASILAGSTLTLTGLTGSQAGNNLQLPISVFVAPNMTSEQTAAFYSATGLLVISMGIGAPAETAVSVMFRFLNGAAPPPLSLATVSGRVLVGACQEQASGVAKARTWQGQDASTKLYKYRAHGVRALLGGGEDQMAANLAKICEALVDADIVSSDSVSVPALALNFTLLDTENTLMIVSAEIAESSRVKGAFDMISVRIRCNFDIKAPATITIAGLDGSQTVKTSRLIPVSNWIDLFPNCSCPYSEVPFPCLECAGEDADLIASSFRIWQPDIDSTGTNLFGTVTFNSNRQPVGTADGSWNPLCPLQLEGTSCLILSLASGQQHPANTDLDFAFLLQNSHSLSASVSPTVHINCGGISVKTVMSGSVLGAANDPGFTLLAIEENSEILGGFATITVQLQTNCPLFSSGNMGASLTIGGLAQFQTPTGYLPIQGDGAIFVSRDGWGYWKQDQGTIVFNGAVIPGDCSSSLDHSIVPMCSQVVAVFTMTLKNKLLTTIGQDLPTAAASSDTMQLSAALFGGLPLNRASVPPSFSLAAMRESSGVQGQANNISFTFSCNTNLISYDSKHQSSAASITVTGLVGTGTPDAGSLQLSGANATLFAPASTTWSQANGVLILYLASSKNVAPGDVVDFSIVVINPTAMQQTSVSISAMVYPYPDGTSPPIPVPIIVNYGLPMVLVSTVVAGFDVLSARIEPNVTSSSISESNLVSSAINTISLMLTLNVDVQAGGSILLSGLQYTTLSIAQIVVSGPDGDSVGSAVWDKTAGTMLLNLAAPIYADSPFSVAFKLQNRQCSSPPPGRTATVVVRGPFSPGSPEVSIGPVNLAGMLFGCGQTLLWRARTAVEFSGVTWAYNTLTFSVQPSAPLYGGTVVTVNGLVGTQTATCISCLTKSKSVVWTLGMGCSLLCEEDSCTALTGTTACIPVFSGSPPNPSEVFGSLGQWTQHSGTLVITVQAGQTLLDTVPTNFSIMLWNPVQSQTRVDCTPQNTDPTCLRVSVSSGTFCDSTPTRLDSEGCKSGVYSTAIGSTPSYASYTITSNSLPLSNLYDSCPNCLRSPNIIAVHIALQAIQGPSFAGLVADPPSLDYQPTLIQGGLISGTYVLLLSLTNWLGMSSNANSTFTSDGPGTLTDTKPFVYIEGPPVLYVGSLDTVELSANGTAAACIEGYQTETVSYVWSLACVGSVATRSTSDPICALTPQLTAIVPEVLSATLSIPPASLTAGAVFQVTCSVRQQNLQFSTSSYVEVQAVVSPIVAIISGGASQVLPVACTLFAFVGARD